MLGSISGYSRLVAERYARSTVGFLFISGFRGGGLHRAAVFRDVSAALLARIRLQRLRRVGFRHAGNVAARRSPAVVAAESTSGFAGRFRPVLQPVVVSQSGTDARRRRSAATRRRSVDRKFFRARIETRKSNLRRRIYGRRQLRGQFSPAPNDGPGTSGSFRHSRNDVVFVTSRRHRDTQLR